MLEISKLSKLQTGKVDADKNLLLLKKKNI